MTRYTLRDPAGTTREIDVPEDALPSEINSFGSLGWETDQIPSTMWQRVYVLDHATGEETCHTVAIDPDEPACTPDLTLDEGIDRGSHHKWRSPIALVGGIAENPGVWGHGGGVRIHVACVLCGCKRVTDTWAQDPETGEQGLTSVAYFEGAFTANEIAEALS